MTALPWLPNFIIAGAPKAGTSSLFRWIADHPDAFGSVDKETYFFVDPGTHMHSPDFHISNGLETYRTQFPVPDGADPKVILEATPSYIYNASALEHIPTLPSQPRCLFILREPAAQIYSLYTYFRDNWDWVPSSMGFDEFLSAARTGSHDFKGNELARNAYNFACYAQHLEPWRERLGADRIMVATFDELQGDPAAMTRRVAAWLNLDTSFYNAYDFPRENETYAPRNRQLQSLNIAVRGLLPKGKAYDALRSVYRRFNTRAPEGPGNSESDLIARLREEFAPHNKRLASEFDLNVTGWG